MLRTPYLRRHHGKFARSTLPPLSTTATRPTPRSARNSSDSTAPTATAPLGSITSFARSHTSRIAATLSSSRTATTRSPKSRRQRRRARGDAAAVLLDGPALHGRGVPRHDDVGRDAALLRRQGQRLRVVARAVRHHAEGRRVRRQPGDDVGGAAELEGAGLLK